MDDTDRAANTTSRYFDQAPGWNWGLVRTDEKFQELGGVERRRRRSRSW
jgi:hypothetical protein